MDERCSGGVPGPPEPTSVLLCGCGRGTEGPRPLPSAEVHFAVAILAFFAQLFAGPAGRERSSLAGGSGCVFRPFRVPLDPVFQFFKVESLVEDHEPLKTGLNLVHLGS